MRKSTIYLPDLLDISFFDNLRKLTSTLNIQKLKTKLKLHSYAQGDIVFSNSEERTFVFVIKGKIALYLSQQNNYQDYQVVFLQQGQHFGETETVSQKIVFKAVAEKSTTVYKLSVMGMYQHMRAVFTFPELQSKICYIKSLPYFQNIHNQTFERMIQSSLQMHPTKNTVIYSQGQHVPYVFVIMRGDFQISKKVKKSRTFYCVDVCTVSVGECLGLQQIMLNQPSQQNVTCVSSDSWLVLLKKQDLKGSFINLNKSLIKSRSNWRKQRVKDYEQVIDKYRFVTQVEPKQEDQTLIHHYSYEQFVHQREQEKKTRHLSSRPKQSRPQTSSCNKTVDNTYFNLLPSHNKRPTRTVSTDFSIHKPLESIGDKLLIQFLQKKQKVQNKMLLRYIKTRPPELVFNPEKQFAVMKSLNVKPSDAVKSRKKTLTILKHKYFKQPELIKND